MKGAEVALSVTIFPEDDQWSARCEELDLVSCGDSIDEALNNIQDLVQVYLATISEQGELQRIFTERGIPLPVPGQQPAGEPGPVILRASLRVPAPA